MDEVQKYDGERVVGLPDCPKCGEVATYQTPDGVWWDGNAHYWRERQEVLVPASRFISKCGHDAPNPMAVTEKVGDSYVARIAVLCLECGEAYEQDGHVSETNPHE